MQHQDLSKDVDLIIQVHNGNISVSSITARSLRVAIVDLDIQGAPPSHLVRIGLGDREHGANVETLEATAGAQVFYRPYAE